MNPLREGSPVTLNSPFCKMMVTFKTLKILKKCIQSLHYTVENINKTPVKTNLLQKIQSSDYSYSDVPSLIRK
jgi:hypothetical protein